MKKIGLLIGLVIVLMVVSGCVTIHPTDKIVPVSPFFHKGGTQVTVINGMRGSSPYHARVLGDRRMLAPGQAMTIFLHPFLSSRTREIIVVQFFDIRTGQHIRTRTKTVRVHPYRFQERVWIVRR